MTEAYVQLFCPACETDWEDRPTDLPAPEDRTTCEHCGESRHTSEFMRTHRDLEILRDFQG